MRLQVELLEGWGSLANPDGPSTFVRHRSGTPGPLQVSWAEYRGGPLPNPSGEDLLQMAQDFGRQQGFQGPLRSWHGPCAFGRIGTAVFRSTDYPRIQIWFLSNGRDFINVTHYCGSEPEPVEVAEAEEIARRLTLGPDKPWWKVW